MASGLLLPARRRPTPGLLYVGGVAALTVLLLALAAADVIPPALVALVAIPLGPLGLAGVAALVAFSLGITVDGSVPLLAVDAGVLAAVLVLATANVLVVAATARSIARQPVDAAFRGRLPQRWDRLAGVACFLLAGSLFVLLCVLAGAVFLTAGGVDTPAPAAQAALLRTVSAVTWVLGLVAAVAGLVLWIAAGARRRPMLRWAAADLALQIVALGAVVAVLATAG